MKKWVLGLVLLFALSSLPAFSATAPKPGSMCSKSGNTQTSNGKRYTCIKSGKKLVWNNGVKVKEAAPQSTPYPTPTPAPTTSLSPSAIQIQTDQVDIKGFIQYGINEGLLTRFASNRYFQTDSRSENQFSDIRNKAYKVLNDLDLSTGHPNINFIYYVSPNFPTQIESFIRKELYQSASIFNQYLDTKINIYVDLVTEKDRERVSKSNWLTVNLPNLLDRLESNKERRFVSGGGAYFYDKHPFDLDYIVNDGSYEGRIFLATASNVDLSYMTNEWPNVPSHEFVHVIQDYFKKPGWDINVPIAKTPYTFREGSANTFGYLIGFDNKGWASDSLDWNFWHMTRQNCNWATLKNVSDTESLIEFIDSASEDSIRGMPYPVGSLMYEWLFANYGLDGYVTLLKNLRDENSLDKAFLKSFGFSQKDFNAKVAPYIYEIYLKTQPCEN